MNFDHDDGKRMVMDVVDSHLVLNALNRAVLAIEAGVPQNASAEVLLMADYLPQAFRLQHLGDNASAQDIAQWLAPYAALTAHLAEARVQLDFSAAFLNWPAGSFRAADLLRQAHRLMGQVTPSTLRDAGVRGEKSLRQRLTSMGDASQGAEETVAHLVFAPLD